MRKSTEQWLEYVVKMAEENAANGEGPFAAVVVRDDEIIGSGLNSTKANQDPTAHAELLAIREACTRLGTTDLSDSVLYASGEPCPMCMGAVYWARPRAVIYACPKSEAFEAVQFTDPLHQFYEEMTQPEKRTIPLIQVDIPRKLEPFIIWSYTQKKSSKS